MEILEAEMGLLTRKITNGDEGIKLLKLEGKHDQVAEKIKELDRVKAQIEQQQTKLQQANLLLSGLANKIKKQKISLKNNPATKNPNELMKTASNEIKVKQKMKEGFEKQLLSIINQKDILKKEYESNLNDPQ